MKIKFLISGALTLALFFIFTFIVATGRLNNFDLKITILLQSIIPRFMDLPFSVLSLIGSAEIVSLIILTLWAIYRKMNIISVFFSFVIFHIVELIGKTIVYHPGPTSNFFRYIFQFSFPTSGVKPGSSFPSGHLGRTIFISVLVFAFIFKDKRLGKQSKYFITILILLFDFLMFISRIYLGEHWFTDVMGGSLAGLSFAIISLAF